MLGHADHTGLMKPTPLFERLMKAANEIKPVLIGIDTSADVFAGNENDRAQVRQFVGMLRKLSDPGQAYVIVNSHPSLTGINTGSGLSGSTGWHNSVRARAYLTTAKTGQRRRARSEPADAGIQEEQLRPHRQEHGAALGARRLCLVGGIGSLDRLAAEQHAERLFLALLDRFNRPGPECRRQGGREKLRSDSVR